MTQPYSIISNTSTLSFRLWSSRGAFDRSYSSRVYFRKMHHALRMRWSTSIVRSALWLTFPPRYTNSFVWLYTQPAASTLNTAVESDTAFVHKHMISVLGLRYGEVKRRAHDYDHPHNLSRLLGRMRDDPGIVSVKHAPKRRRQKSELALRQLLPPAPPPPFSSSGASKRP